MDIQDSIYAKSQLPAWAALTGDINRALTIAQLFTTSVANVFSSIVTGYASGVTSVSQNTRRTISTLTGGIEQIGTSIASSVEKGSSEFYLWTGVGSQDNAPVGEQVLLESIKRQMYNSMRVARINYTTTRNAVAQQSAALTAQVQVFVAPKNLDLRDVSTTYYKTPNYWQQLMQYNDLTSSKLNAGQQIDIPPITTFSSSTGNL